MNIKAIALSFIVVASLSSSFLAEAVCACNPCRCIDCKCENK